MTSPSDFSIWSGCPFADRVPDGCTIRKGTRLGKAIVLFCLESGGNISAYVAVDATKLGNDPSAMDINNIITQLNKRQS